jgi:hypothetical protein
MNKALLCKLLRRFNSTTEKELWKIIISQRYRNRRVITHLSPFLERSDQRKEYL